MQKSSSTSAVLSTSQWIVPLILLVSLLLRWILILRGGQYYFSDEGRYETSWAFVEAILDGNLTDGFPQLFIAPEHLGFKIIGIIPAFAEQLTRESLVIPALFFSLFSTFNVFLVYKIAKRAGAGQPYFALILAASSMSLLYYARHLVPYDAALTFGLFAIYTAISEETNRKTSLLCGALSFACFITYNGYWSLAGLAILLHVLRSNESFYDIIRKSVIVTMGFVLPAILLFLLAAWSGINLLTEYSIFASTVSQGSYAEGWSLPFEYFWHTEHWILILFVLLSGYAAFSHKGKNRAVNIWTGALMLLYLSLLIPSVFLHSFVVYGRLARQLTPFLILLASIGLEGLKRDFPSGQKFVHVLLVIVGIQALWNYQASYALSYPREFGQEAQALRPEFAFSEKRLAFGAPPLCQNNGYVIENVKHFATPPEANPPVQGQLLISAPHPDNFLPYQYEGYTYEQRRYLRELRPEMRFYRADANFMSDSNPTWKTMKNCRVGEN